MTVDANRVNVGTQPSALINNGPQPDPAPTYGEWATRQFLLKNKTGTAPVFLGAANVSTSNGFEWAPTDGPLDIELEPGESLYGVADTQQTIHVLAQGR